MPAPTITAISGDTAPTAGGTTLVITGTNLDTVTNVDYFDAGTTACSFVIDSPTQITVASMPAHARAIGWILVTNPFGNAVSEDCCDPFAYDDSSTAPRVTFLNFYTGPTAGGSGIEIFGARFTGATAVDFGATPAASFSVLSDGQISAVSPPTGFPHGVYVKVTAGGEDSPVGVPVVFVYTGDPPPGDPPVVTSVTPNYGPVEGGNEVTIDGSNFDDVESVAVGGVESLSWSSTSSQITATVPPHAAGIVHVIVTTANGSSG